LGIERDITMEAAVVELATSLNRYRSLEDREVKWLERALRREMRANGSQAFVRNGWKKDIPRLRRMVKKGMRPAQIALKLGRTTGAVRRQMHLIGIGCEHERARPDLRKRSNASAPKMRDDGE
jgi:hypothetical protein